MAYFTTSPKTRVDEAISRGRAEIAPYVEAMVKDNRISLVVMTWNIQAGSVQHCSIVTRQQYDPECLTCAGEPSPQDGDAAMRCFTQSVTMALPTCLGREFFGTLEIELLRTDGKIKANQAVKRITRELADSGAGKR